MLRADIEFVVDRPLAAATYCCTAPPRPAAPGCDSGEVIETVVSARGSPPAGRVVIDTMPPVAPLP